MDTGMCYNPMQNTVFSYVGHVRFVPVPSLALILFDNNNFAGKNYPKLVPVKLYK